MDSASSIRVVYPGRSSYPGNARTNQPWSKRFLHRRTLLINESRHFRCLGHSVLLGVTFSLAFASLVTRSDSCISRRRRPIGGLVTKLSPWLCLSTSLDTPGPIYSIE